MVGTSLTYLSFYGQRQRYKLTPVDAVLALVFCDVLFSEGDTPEDILLLLLGREITDWFNQIVRRPCGIHVGINQILVVQWKQLSESHHFS